MFDWIPKLITAIPEAFSKIKDWRVALAAAIVICVIVWGIVTIMTSDNAEIDGTPAMLNGEEKQL